MNDTSRYADVQQLISQYFHGLDNRDFPAMLNCLTEDVDWRVSSVRSGRDDVAKAMEERPTDFEVRHLITNLFIDTNESSINAKFLITTFAHFLKEGDEVPFPMTPPLILADVATEIVETDQGLKFKSFIASILFKNPVATHVIKNR